MFLHVLSEFCFQFWLQSSNNIFQKIKKLNIFKVLNDFTIVVAMLKEDIV